MVMLFVNCNVKVKGQLSPVLPMTYGWAIAKSLAAAGAEILVGTWVPALNIFEMSLRRGKFDASRVLPDGSLMEITKVYPLDAVFDNPE
ncbi:enoyl-[acyl-carrier-protein] reductase [NADH], chloroplastic-like [Bidens hawaiensis]|uniref:enoyl-[acyl-carrier-protein] reductase [NADH], chloroplastic-like n=1 Tax=Bidens hawaiensis TaxID=980011 RepID=UPI00404AFC5C